MKPPVMDSRNEKDIYNQILKLAKQYVPEWNTDTEGEDSGLILASVYSKMFADTIQRFNKMPYKNFMYFLNILGADVLGGMNAQGFVTVKMNPGDYEGVAIKKGTKLYTQPHEADTRVLYETKDEMFALDNEVTTVFCQNADSTIIVKPFDGEKKQWENNSYKLFDFKNYKNLQKHRITFCENQVFNIGAYGAITIKILHNEKPFLEQKVAQFLGDSKKAVWKFLSADGWKEISEVNVVDNEIIITPNASIDAAIYKDIESRWISCTIIDINDDIDISFTEIRVSSKEKNLVPDSLYFNDNSLTAHDFMPFGETFNVYDYFYINCEKAFTKTGASITAEIDIKKILSIGDGPKVERKIKWRSIMPESAIREPEPSVVNVERVAWEYWNGKGWARLFPDNSYEDVFKLIDKNILKINFNCPNDMDTAIIGANQGRWIRARITNINNIFDINKVYNAPFIEKMTFGYTYKKEDRPLNRLFVERDLEVFELDLKTAEEVILYSKIYTRPPTTYFALKNTFKRGPIKIFFHNAKRPIKNTPAIKWEYFTKHNGVFKWIELKLMDETKFFSQSGLITFVTKEKAEKLYIFGKEAYWIRAINTDSRYEEDYSKLPHLKGIYFNTVRIEQQETMETEYFFINVQEQNKLCILNGDNVIEEKVWINEVSSLIADERNKHNSEIPENTIIERDNDGIITEFWVQWKRVENFNECSYEDKVYMIDKKRGRILFGDGKNGKIPNSSYDSTIRVDYKVGVGKMGNCKINGIDGFADAVPFVDKVENIEPICGGYDTEDIKETIDRCLKIAAVQNRAVGETDFCYVAMEADRNIVRVKMLPYRDEDGNEARGHISLYILPRDVNFSEEYIYNIRENVKKVLMKKAPVTLTTANRIHIKEVDYVEFSISVDLTVSTYNDYQDVYIFLQGHLKKYFDPIIGNFDEKGFEIGELPSRMKIYNYIKTISRIRSIDEIHINCCLVYKEERKEINYSDAIQMKTAVPINGNHEINISILQQ